VEIFKRGKGFWTEWMPAFPEGNHFTFFVCSSVVGAVSMLWAEWALSYSPDQIPGRTVFLGF